MTTLAKVISGGQTGVDQAALRAAKACGIPTGGCAPKGWLTEDGRAGWLADYGLLEMLTDDYPTRTRANVSHSSACLWIGDHESPGGRLTLRLCKAAPIPVFTVGVQFGAFDHEHVAGWLREKFAYRGLDGEPATLMVAGNRERKAPGIGRRAESFLRDVFAAMAAPIG